MLRSFLRQDPDIILLGEIRDLDSASIAFKAAMTGHLVLSTLHTNDAIGTIDRLITMGIDRFIIASAVKVILAQRLIRKLCLECRQPADIPHDELVMWGMTRRLAELAGLDFDAPTVQLQKAVGCQVCNEGYKGRVGIHEVLPFGEPFREKILAGASNFELQEAALETGMLTLRDSALVKALRGVTGLDEVKRLTAAATQSKTQRAKYKLEDAVEQSAGPALPATTGASIPEPVGALIEHLDRLVRITSAVDLTRPLTLAAGLAAEVLRASTNGGKVEAKDKLGLLALYLETLREFVDSNPSRAETVDVNSLVKDSLLPRADQFAERARLLSGQTVDLAKISLTTSLEAGLPAGLADPERLRMCLEQVVVNSLCFVPPGGKLGFTTKRVHDDSGRDFVEISVLDTGPGLRENLGDVTQPGIAGTAHGLGLGLAIVQRYMSQMKGRVEIKSKPGKGCLVKFRVPASTR
ncbi:MAG: Flp pilus assembly complex ATPase component TadA [Candidatus Riflebacteria bacterium]|nr:Flp pilus assembly complex ATPase component TadA [Candidatus Riflebacteria bacterium]